MEASAPPPVLRIAAVTALKKCPPSLSRSHRDPAPSRQGGAAPEAADPGGDMFRDLSVQAALHPVAGRPLGSPASLALLHQQLLLPGVP